MKLRAIMLSLIALASVACSARAEDATDYPSKKIKMLLPFGAGGGGDVLGRLLADRMGKRLGQTIYVENRTGAAGTIGAQQAATSPPDGYTITIGGMTTHVLAPAVYPNLPYDPIKDFTTIGRIGTSSILVVAANDFAANDVRGLAEMSKKGDPIQYGSWGVGSTGHFCGEILSQKADVRLQHVPFSGAAKLANDLMGGHISVGLVDMATGTPLVKDGKLKGLAVCGRPISQPARGRKLQGARRRLRTKPVMGDVRARRSPRPDRAKNFRRVEGVAGRGRHRREAGRARHHRRVHRRRSAA